MAAAAIAFDMGDAAAREAEGRRRGKRTSWFGRLAALGKGKRQHQPAHFWQPPITQEEYREMRQKIRFYLANRNYPEALELYRALARKLPSYARIRISIGSVLAKMEKYEEALDEYSGAMKMVRDGRARYGGAEGDLARAYKKVGTVLYKLGRKDEAIGWLGISIRLYEKLGESGKCLNHAKAIGWLARMMEERGMDDEAGALFRKARAICPHYQDASGHALRGFGERVQQQP